MTTDKYRRDIDGLRALAVSAVLAFHAAPHQAPGGFIGVDIFFVISGYLITGILYGDIERKQFSILKFYARRVRRIFPALVVVLLFTLSVGWWLLFRPEFWALGRHVAASALFVENLQLWSEAGYFDVSSLQKPLLHLWSLAVEEQFYIFWPVLLFLSYRVGAGALALILALLSFSLLLNAHDATTDPTAAFYSPLGRFWEPMVGAALAVLERRRKAALPRKACDALSFLGAGVLLCGFALINEARPFPGYWALLPTIGTALLIAAGPNGWVNRRVFSLGPIVFVGLVSYSLYLWHWPLITYGYLAFGDHSAVRVLACALAFGLASATYYFVEKPLRFGAWRSVKPLTIASSMAGMLGLGVVVMSLHAPPRLAQIEVPTRHEWEYLLAMPKPTDAGEEGIYRLGGERPRVALFIGDSNIAQYAERLNSIIEPNENDLGAVFAIGGGCVPVEHVFTDDVTRKNCWPLRERAFEMARNSKVENVVLGGSWNWYFYDQTYYFKQAGKSFPLTSQTGRKLALDQIATEIATLRGAGKRVFVMLGNPVDERLNPFAVNRIGGAESALPPLKVSLNSDQEDLRQHLIALATKAGASVIDPYPMICPAQVCDTRTKEGMPVFKDRSHFNPDWTKLHASFIDPTVFPH
jgi:peptidoglycan/LPS O-acetylase OafA/YrhL